MKYLSIRFLVLAFLALTTSACVTNEDGSGGNDLISPSYIRLSPSAPPHRPLEVKPFPDSPQRQIWRQGYWNYDGSTFTWIPGTYMAKPTPNAAWMPDRWEKRAFGWAFIPGYWH